MKTHVVSLLLFALICAFGFVLGNVSSDGKCYTKVDLVFLLDSSGSVTISNWAKQIEYVEQVIGNFDVSESGTHIGVIDFSHEAKIRVDINSNTGKQKEAINKILEDLKGDYQGGMTYTELGLTEAFTMFSKIPISRNVPKILIVVTDGQTTWKSDKTGMELIQGPIKKLQTLNVTTYSVAVGRWVADEELLLMANNDPNHVLKLDSFEDLLGSLRKLIEIACPTPPVTTPTTPTKPTSPTTPTPTTTPRPTTPTTLRPLEPNTTACSVKFNKIGCFKDNMGAERPLPEYILNDRDPSTSSFSGRFIDWKNSQTYMPDFICRCAKKAIAMDNPQRTVFGIQYFGECWTSPKATTYDKDGPGEPEGCRTAYYKRCKANSPFCVGGAFHNFVYRIDEESIEEKSKL